MVIHHRTKRRIKQELKTPLIQNDVISAFNMDKSEKIQPKQPVSKKSTGVIKPEVKTESQVEIKEEEEKIIGVSKKRSLLEEVLEEQTALDA